MILNSISFRKIMNIRDMQSKRFNFYSKALTLAVSIIAMAFLFSFSNAMEKGVWITDQDVNAQSERQQQQRILRCRRLEHGAGGQLEAGNSQ